MSYDGEYLTAITKSCIETERDLKQEEDLFYPKPDSNRLIQSIKCRERRCRVLDLYSNLNEGLGSFVNTNDSEYYTAEFSEEGGAEGICIFPYFVTRIYCYNKDCDNKKLLCKKIKSAAGVIVSTSSTDESGFFTSGDSNSQTGDCPTDYYLIGIKCDGGYCRNINLVCRKVFVSECKHEIDCSSFFITRSLILYINCTVQFVPQYTARTNLKLYSKANNWDDETDSIELDSSVCGITNSFRSNSQCIACADTIIDGTGLAFQLNNDAVRFIKDASTEVKHNVNSEATFGSPVAPLSFSNGDSLNILVPGDDKNGLVVPTNLTSIVSGFGECAAILEDKVAAVSAPNTSKDEIPNIGAILFYKWDEGTWEYDEIEYGRFSNQKLGLKQLEFFNDDTLKVVSEGFKIEYLKNKLVSVPRQKILQRLTFQFNSWFIFHFQEKCPLNSAKEVSTDLTSDCICNEGYIATNDDRLLTRIVSENDFCTIAYYSTLILHAHENEKNILTIQIADDSSQSVDDAVDAVEMFHVSDDLDNPVKLILDGKLTINTDDETLPNYKDIVISGLIPGNRYITTVLVENGNGPDEAVTFPIVPSCSCDAVTNPDKTGRPKKLIVYQDQGHVMFNFTDNSKCEAAFSFSRFSGFAEFTDDSVLATSFTDDYTFNSPKQCDAEVSTGTKASDDLKVSRLSVGSTYSYCARAVKNGEYMDLTVSELETRVISSSTALCESHTVSWEASIDGLVTTEPNAGSLAIKGVEVTWKLMSEDGTTALSCDGCMGSTTSDEGGAFSIPFNVHHSSLKETNLADIPVHIIFSKKTHTRNETIDHIFLCNEGQDICDPDQGYTFYLKHLHFDTPLHIYDDTSLPFTGYLTVYNTQYPGSDGCIIDDAQVCLQHYTAGGILENLVCVQSQNDGLYEAPAIIGSVVNNVKINYSSHDFEKTFKNNWDYSAGVVITDGGFYSGNDFMDVTRAKMNVQGEFLIWL